MRRAEIARKFDEIVAFAEVEKFLDTPVKRYSSGMYVRLAFAVAAHLEPRFWSSMRCWRSATWNFRKNVLVRLAKSPSGGRTVLFVSHNMAAIEALCPRTIHARVRCDRSTTAKRRRWRPPISMSVSPGQVAAKHLQYQFKRTSSWRPRGSRLLPFEAGIPLNLSFLFVPKRRVRFGNALCWYIQRRGFVLLYSTSENRAHVPFRFQAGRFLPSGCELRRYR